MDSSDGLDFGANTAAAVNRRYGCSTGVARGPANAQKRSMAMVMHDE